MSKQNLLLRLRYSLIPFTLISKRMRLYNGIWYLSTDITGQMIGFKTGSFSFTRRCDPSIHGKDRRKRKKMAMKKLKKQQKQLKLNEQQ